MSGRGRLDSLTSSAVFLRSRFTTDLRLVGLEVVLDSFCHESVT